VLTGAAISEDRNMKKKGAEKMLKCKNLTTEMQRLECNKTSNNMGK
jgi:hypothetical protein